MELTLIIIAGILILLGIIGSFLPVLPGPPLAYLGLVIMQFAEPPTFSMRLMILLGSLTILVLVLDYLVPVYGTKRLGASQYGIWGSTLGIFFGLFLFPPLGLIIGPFAGALLGELISGKTLNDAVRAGFGAFLGFLAGTFMKISLCLVITYYFIQALI
ncbi:MAG: DUF456 domain-containing protein [Candidatus Cyclobacteriaceae bacterium M3_2C_046]